MPIELSETMSKWVGDSEKRVKEIFTRYKAARKNCALAPILFFNEADGLIGKRSDLGSSSPAVEQMRNTMQNILLQEIENLDGILIATTNLVQNMDSAFERRFLYKIEFEMPESAARQAIWQTMIPELTVEEAEKLAKEFAFSGGQIENVARRRTVASVLYGSAPSLDELLNYCREELTGKEVKRIGFGV